ncbi:hypothetical protein P9112_013534 [Eukaryota sp. TZLM1-RC]
MSQSHQIPQQSCPSVQFEQPPIYNVPVQPIYEPPKKRGMALLLVAGIGLLVIGAIVVFVLSLSGENSSNVSDYFPISGTVSVEDQSLAADVTVRILNSQEEESTQTTNGKFEVVLFARPYDDAEITVSVHDDCFQSAKLTETVEWAQGLSIRPKPASKEFEVSGTVYFDGSPSSNARVSVQATEGSSQQRSQTTDSSGRFSIPVDGYCNSDFDVTVTANDDSFDDKLLTVSMDDRQDVDIAVIKTYTVTGTLTLWGTSTNVVDVRLIDSAGTSQEVTPNLHGRYTFYNVAKGSGKIGTHPYWDATSREIHVGHDTNFDIDREYVNIEITMKVQQSGSPVPGAMIIFNEQYYIVTGADGIQKWHAGLIPGASYTITVYGQRHMPITTKFVIGEDPTVTFDLTPASIEFTHSGDVVAIDFANSDWYDSSSLHSEWSDVAFCQDRTIYWDDCGSSMNNVNCGTHIQDLSFKLLPDWTRALDFTGERHTIGGQQCVEVKWEEENTVHHYWCLSFENHNLRYHRRERSWGIWSTAEELHFRSHAYYSYYTKWIYC